MNTYDATQYIGAVFRDALGMRAAVVDDPEDATGHLLAGTPVVVLAPPTITEDTGPARVFQFETPIIGAPAGDRETAWRAVDQILNRLDAHIQFDRAEPITWTGAQTATAPAYLLTHTLTAYKEGH
nr:MAG TPA: hypothetical protein [Caudoviricetes sp.]